MEVRTGQADPEHASHQRISSADQPDHHVDDLPDADIQKYWNVFLLLINRLNVQT